MNEGTLVLKEMGLPLFSRRQDKKKHATIHARSPFNTWHGNIESSTAFFLLFFFIFILINFSCLAIFLKLPTTVAVGNLFSETNGNGFSTVVQFHNLQ